MGGETDDEGVGQNEVEDPVPVKKKKRHVTFNEGWANFDTFSEWVRPTQGDPFSAACIVCPAKIVIKHEGRLALENHAKSKKHVAAVQSKRNSRAIDVFMLKKGSPEEDKVAAAELCSVYHGVRHGHSYLPTDCGVKLNALIFKDSSLAPKVSCGRTKSEALVENVLAPYSQERLVAELKKTPFFSVSSDASNSGSTKVYPYTVQYFHEEEGVKYGLLDFYEDANETSRAIYDQMVSITESCGLGVSKISSYGADNASVNYGKHNSVYQKLKEINPYIVKANCKCHLIHNTLKNANRILSAAGHDVECIVLKIYSEFSCSAKKVETLKEFCQFTAVQYKQILRHVPTRWLSLLPAIQRILECWPALKSYFMSLEKSDCPGVIWDAMCSGDEDDVTVSECVFLLMHNVMQEFDSAIRVLEGESVSVLDIQIVMTRLRDQLVSRRTDKFYGSKTRQAVRQLDPCKQAQFTGLADRFFQKGIQYLESHFDFNDPLLLSSACL